jgi:hypothetical protein
MAEIDEQFTAEFRSEVARLLINGLYPSELAEQHELGPEVLVRWVLEHLNCYYPQRDSCRSPDEDEERFVENLDNLYGELAKATAQRAPQQKAGVKRGKQKIKDKQEAERWHRSFVDKRLGKNTDALKDAHLAAHIEADDAYNLMPDSYRRVAQWIRDYVKTLWRLEQLIDDELERSPEAFKDPELAQRLSQKARKFPKKQRRDLKWIQAYLRAPQFCQQLIDEELEQDSSALEDSSLPERLFDRLILELPDESRREIGWVQAYVKKLRRKLATAEH